MGGLWGFGDGQRLIACTHASAGLHRARVSHADHKTILLHGWHRMLMNTEHQARAMRNGTFLD
jgi:hypothetical protein